MRQYPLLFERQGVFCFVQKKYENKPWVLQKICVTVNRRNREGVRALPDQGLIAQLRGKETEAVEALLKEYGPLMRYVIRPILTDLRDQEECLWDAALQCWNGIDKYDPAKSSFSTWLTAITRNAAISRLRKQPPQMEELNETLAAVVGDPEAAFQQKEMREYLQKAICSLRHSDRLLFYRKYYYLQSTAQIAAELGMTQRAVEGKLYRIRQKLQRQLGGDGL